MIGVSENKQSFVVRFYRNPAGELCCRVTDAISRESWTIDQASEIWRLLVDGCPPDGA